MNPVDNPQLLDRLAAAYALGSLRGGARRRFEQLARDNASVRAAALLWQGRWSGLVEMQNPVEPEPAVWLRIDNLLQAEKARTQLQASRPGASRGWWASLAWWRTAAALGACASLASIMLGSWFYQGAQQVAQAELTQLQTALQTAQTALQAAPHIQYVAVLADDKADASMLVTFDPRKQSLVLQRLGSFQEGDDQSLQLWALPPQGGPRSLGVLGHEPVLRLSAGESDVQAVPTLAISLEPKGGVPAAGGPTGPVLFKGALIRRAL